MSPRSHFRTRALLLALSAILASTSQLAQAFHVESGTPCTTVGAACSYLSNDMSAGGQNSTQVNGFCGPDMTCASNGANCNAHAQCFNYCGSGTCGGNDALCNSRDAPSPKESKITCALGFTCSTDGETGTCAPSQSAASISQTPTGVTTAQAPTGTPQMLTPLNMNPQMPSTSTPAQASDTSPALAVSAAQPDASEPCDDVQTPVVSTEEPCDDATPAGSSASNSGSSNGSTHNTPSQTVPVDSSNSVIGMNVPAGNDAIQQAAAQVANMDIPANMDPNPCDEKPKPSQSHHNHKHDKDHKKHSNGRRNDKKRLAAQAAIEARQVRAQDLRPRFTPIAAGK